MRVISGKAKGRKLKLVPGDSTRPMMDRVKENLFNILGQFVVGSTWLDLFAGTGQVGIEALSRGAAHVLFVDNGRAAIKVINENLATTGLAENATVVQTDAFRVLDGGSGPYDVVYVAPPQYKDLWLQALLKLDERPFAYLTPEGLIIVQIDPREEQALELANLHEIDRRRYGSTLLLFYEAVSVT
jgi:16S rRNA (guanine(966)-N(2))-methyltransferase RsmD